MSCDICTRVQMTTFLCPTCARNRLYQLRADNAKVLLERELLGQQIETAVNSNRNQENHPSEFEKHNVTIQRPRLWAFQNISNAQAQSSARTKILAGQIESLQSQIKDKIFEISQRKRETGLLSSIRNNIKRTDHLWHSSHVKTAEARIFLCREAASLYSLRQKVSKRDDGLKERYTIGDVSILDLREMNGNINTRTDAAPGHISTSFSYIAYVLVLVSNYLSLRLPAEITLPHKNYPTASIYTPSASYLPRGSPSASSSDNLSSSNPTASRTHTPAPRPRPLGIDKSLPKLAKEDPGTYALFIEGVTLLAWNVSWLCRSQGLNVGSDSWEDVCDIGKNLWQLLVAPPGQTSTLVRALAGRDIQAKNKPPRDSPRTTIQRTKSFPMLGHYSHGTAHSFLGASEGTEFVRSWRLPTPTKVVDRLKSTLLGEMTSAEWELLEEKEWDGIPRESTKPIPHESAKNSDPTRDPPSSSTDTRILTPELDAPDTPNIPARFPTLLEIPNDLRGEFSQRNAYRDPGDSKPACGSIKQGTYNTPLHVMALFLILVLSTLACSFPILARRFPRLPIPRRFLFLSRHFGTGVLIATAFVHLLPTAFVSLTDPCLPRFWSESYRAMAGFVAMISVFGVVLVEMFFAMKGAGHVHGSEYDQLIGEGADSNTDDRAGDLSYSRLDARASTDNIHLSPMHETRMPTSTQTEACDGRSRNSVEEFSLEGSSTHFIKEDTVDSDESGWHGNSDPDRDRNIRRSKYSLHHRSQSGISHTDPKMPLQNPQRQLLQCLLLEAGILFHSIFIGMAVSVATGTSFVVLLVAICFHQTFEGFALGSRIASLIPDLFPPLSMRPWLMSLAYGTTTPIGQAIGLILHNFYDPASATGLLMVGITNAISSGLLLFAGLVELLAEDFLSEESYMTLRGQRRFEACIAVAAGALLMAFVGAFA
ncbi:UV radiation resistance protein and autophagy-related subunit 14-domain-containing protein [Aspergillus aurantiobrunneus]